MNPLLLILAVCHLVVGIAIWAAYAALLPVITPQEIIFWTVIYSVASLGLSGFIINRLPD